MKTLVSVITGRKDYPVFNTTDEDKIIEYLKYSQWGIHSVTQDEEGLINIGDTDGGDDTLKIIDVVIIEI